MKAIETLKEISEVWSLFGVMPKETALNVELTTIYTLVSALKR